MQVLVGHLLTDVMANHHQWRYERLAERWQIATAGLRVLALALKHSPELASSVRRALSHQGAGVLPSSSNFSSRLCCREIWYYFNCCQI